MTQRDKLIELLDTNCGYVDEIKADELADRLLDNGIVVLPCRVGDTVYPVCDIFLGELYPLNVISITLKDDKNAMSFITTKNYDDGTEHIYLFGHIGTDILDRHCAEKTLAELEERNE